MIEYYNRIISIVNGTSKITIEEFNDYFIVRAITSQKKPVCIEISFSKYLNPREWKIFSESFKDFNKINNFSDQDDNTLSIGGDENDCYIALEFLTENHEIKVSKSSQIGIIIAKIYNGVRSLKNENRFKKTIFKRH